MSDKKPYRSQDFVNAEDFLNTARFVVSFPIVLQSIISTFGVAQALGRSRWPF